MLIAITGACGTIGRSVVSLALSNSHSARGLDASPAPPESPAQVEYRQLDLCDPAACLEALRGCDAVVHLAAIITGSKGCVDQCKQYSTWVPG